MSLEWLKLTFGTLRPIFSWLPWLDPTICIDADGAEGTKTVLKKMTWPLMDEDGLPSSYVTKVLTCLGKWQVKMQQLIEGFEADPDAPENSKQNLSYFCWHVVNTMLIPICSLLPFYRLDLATSPAKDHQPRQWRWLPLDEVLRKAWRPEHQGNLQWFHEWVPPLVSECVPFYLWMFNMFPSPTMTHSLPGYFRDQDDLGDLYEDAQKMCLGMIGSRDGVVVQKLGGLAAWHTCAANRPVTVYIALVIIIYIYIYYIYSFC